MDDLTLETHKEETKSVSSANELSYLTVKSSCIQGLGLFTSKELTANQVLFKTTGNKVYQTYCPEHASCNPNWLGIGYQEWLEIEEGDIAIYINHSCTPNVMVNDQFEIVTIAPIKENNELLLDYSTTELDPYWKMTCKCGEFNCRKVLRSFQYLPAQLQNLYKKYLSPAFISGLSRVK
jgi:uncharacterized protein